MYTTLTFNRGHWGLGGQVLWNIVFRLWDTKGEMSQRRTVQKQTGKMCLVFDLVGFFPCSSCLHCRHCLPRPLAVVVSKLLTSAVAVPDAVFSI